MLLGSPGSLSSDVCSDSLSCSYSKQSSQELLRDPSVLAIIQFKNTTDTISHPKVSRVDLPLLADTELADADVKEVWRANANVTHGSEHGCNWSATPELLFASTPLDEKSGHSLYQTTETAYTKLLNLVRLKGYPHIARMWNYFPLINTGDGDQERYKQFCLGRYDAFSNNEIDQRQFPAACALGGAGESGIVYLIASRKPVTHFENPLQMSAYRYPRQYGPKSPSFARATLANWEQTKQLYVSGTASILGHKSETPDDCESQLSITIDNIETLISHIGSVIAEELEPKPEMLKIYLREADNLAMAERELRTHFGHEVQMLFTEADICRKELVIEIDGVWNLKN